ncbi:MAG: formate/nitrite transporter family protein, partial [Sphingomonadales bacterium]|nr:formate/nitrite transporter family protein [Sphingomonadales bacterium]
LLAVRKLAYLKSNPLGFAISTMMAGAYVGIGIILIMTLGNEASPASRNLIMGSFFGITLTLIIFAGAELFSGHTMFMTFGYFKQKIKARMVIFDWVACWSGNLIGAMLLGVLFALGGGGGWLDNPESLVHLVAENKVNGSIVELVARAIICNWLICLAIWMTFRTESDAAKCILIFWCLFAFVAAGYEHGIANMTVFTISLLGAHADSVTLTSAWYNLIWVSIGNIIGGAGFIGVAYYLTGIKEAEAEAG